MVAKKTVTTEEVKAVMTDEQKRLLEKYEAKKHVTTSGVKWEEGETKAFKILTEMHARKPFKNARIKKDATVCKVENLEDGKVYELIIGELLQKQLEQEYPSNDKGVWGYVGRSFVVTKVKVAGKRYYNYDVFEV